MFLPDCPGGGMPPLPLGNLTKMESTAALFPKQGSRAMGLGTDCEEKKRKRTKSERWEASQWVCEHSLHCCWCQQNKEKPENTFLSLLRHTHSSAAVNWIPPSPPHPSPPPPLPPPLPPSSCIPTFSLPASSPSVSRSLCVSEDHHPRSLSHSFSISPLSVPHTPPLSGRWAQSARPAALSKERRKIHTIITLTGATCGWWCAVFRQVPAISHPHCFCWFWAASAVGASASAALRLSSHPSSCLLTPLLQLNLHQPSTHLAQTPAKADPASTGGCAWWSPQLTSRKTPGTTPVPATRASQDATVRYGHLHYLSEFEEIEIWSVWRRMWLRVNGSRSSNETSGPDYIRSYNRNKALIDWTVEWVIVAGEVLGLCVCVWLCVGKICFDLGSSSALKHVFFTTLCPHGGRISLLMHWFWLTGSAK